MSRSALSERFPALAKLGVGSRRKIPWIPQGAETDCGAACLTMTLAYFGKHLPLEEVRARAFEGRDGASARFLLEAARDFGLRGRAVSVPEVADLRHLSRASILHWGFTHFVVFDRVTRAGAIIVDPSGGRREVSREEIGCQMTGVAVLLEPSEEFEPERKTKRFGTARFVAELLRRSGMLFRVLKVSVLLQVLALALPLLTGLVVDQVVPHQDIDLLQLLAIGFVGLIGFRFLSSLVRALFLVQLRTEMDAKITLEFLDHMIDLPYSFFQNRTTGDLMMRLNSNATVREMLTGGVLSASLDGLVATLYLVLLLVASSTLGILVAILGAARVALFLLARRRYSALMTASLESQARSRGFQVQMLAGIQTLKAAGAEKDAVQRWSNLFVDELNVSASQGRLSAWSDAVLDALTMGSPLIVLLFGSNLVLDGDLTLGTMLALSALAAGFLAPLSTLVSTGFQFEMLKSYVARIDDVLCVEKETAESGTELARPDLSGEIRLENVAFRYGARGPLVLSDVSLDIAAGSFVALVGTSGAGKTTLASLMLGLYRPAQGRLLFDGLDLEQLDLRWIRRRFGVVTQEPYLFNSTIRSNIALANPSLSQEEIVAAARSAQIHEEILAMPMGYDTVLGHDGSSISGGQRQRVALARALANRPSLLLLDEATSSLDAITEQRVHQELDRLHCTRIVIAHRLSTIRSADQIIVVDKGRVVEAGSYEELTALGGAFADLIAAQQEPVSATIPGQLEAVSFRG